MAITKILARHARLDVGIKYILNGDKTEERILTAHLNCDPGRECREMLDTKRAYGKTDGVQYYHVIQSFKPGEVTPELALEIAKGFAQEHMGYEIYHGNRLGFRLRGQNRFMYPGRKNGLFTEESIRAAIEGNLTAIEAGLRPATVRPPTYRPYKKHPRYTGLLALYVHYLYVLGKAGQRQYPARATPQLRQEVMKAERYRAQFAFLRENEINTPEEMAAFEAHTEETLADLTKQRTILNVRKRSAESHILPWPMWRPWPPPPSSTGTACPGWRRNLPGTWTSWTHWSGAPSPVRPLDLQQQEKSLRPKRFSRKTTSAEAAVSV